MTQILIVTVVCMTGILLTTWASNKLMDYAYKDLVRKINNPEGDDDEWLEEDT